MCVYTSKPTAALLQFFEQVLIGDTSIILSNKMNQKNAIRPINPSIVKPSDLNFHLFINLNFDHVFVFQKPTQLIKLLESIFSINANPRQKRFPIADIMQNTLWDHPLHQTQDY